MATASIIDLYSEPGYWDDFAPAHDAVLAVVGGAVNTGRDETARAIAGLATRSPVALAFMLEGDAERIYIGHSPALYAADPLEVTPMDNLLVVLVGKDLATSTPVILNAEHTARTGAFAAYDRTYLLGGNGHGHVPPVFLHAHAAAGTADTDQLNVRRVFVLPSATASEYLADASDQGAYSVLGFWTRWVQPGLDDADAAIVAATTPLAEWWRGCCMSRAGAVIGDPVVSRPRVTTGNPAHDQRLASHTHRIKRDVLHQLGVAGPQLTTVAFNQGIQDVTAMMNANSVARLQFERDRAEKTFTDKHGEALAERVRRLTGAVDDDHLPIIHQLLAKSSSKSRDYAIIANALVARAESSPVPLTAANAVIPTAKMVEECFRSFLIAGTGLVFAQGLTPFAIVCEGHKESLEVAKITKQAELAESGTSISLQDAERITATDVRFPDEPYIAAEKLYGWTNAVDTFHGANMDVANNSRVMAIKIGPSFHRIFANSATPAAGMNLINRILFEVQQEYFSYVTDLANGVAGIVAPTYSDIIRKVQTYRTESLSPLPASWRIYYDSPAAAPSGATRRAASAAAASGPHVYAKADRSLLRRFQDAPFSTITAMMEGHEVAIPRHAGKEVCLAWALKGQCKHDCKRAELHVNYGATTKRELHQLLTDCGVAGSHE